MIMCIDALESVDRSLLLFINGHHTPWLDGAMWFLTQTYTWIPLYVMMLWLLFVCYGKKTWRILLLLVLVVGTADLVSSGIIKPLVARPRPTHTPGLAEYLHLHQYANGTFYRGGPYGFMSSHAANSSAIALMVLFFLRKKTVRPRLLFGLMVAFVAVFCYTRMYLGVHYPSDILGGLLVGCSCAAAGYYGIGKSCLT